MTESRVDQILEVGIVPSVRVSSTEDAAFAAETVLNAATAIQCLDAGALFISRIVQLTRERNLARMPWTLTPSEVMATRRPEPT